VADVAESLDHHPDIAIEYTKVTLRVTTHDAGGLTENDFTLAGRIEA
jgi:4a-hydroxytetrahydrobiopterin dehydratase